MNVLQGGYDFRSLSIKDLLAARELYHYHLMNRPNVAGTAVGLYLRRDKNDPKTAKTFANSRVQPDSWPCILVFTRGWLAFDEFGDGKKAKASDMVPKTLFMPDGRAVPVCTVCVEETADDGSDRFNPLPQRGFGAGLPVSVSVQGEDHTASIGCLVSDGHLTYALTARHACGPAGTVVFAGMRGHAEPIGVSATRQLTRVPFQEAYADLAGDKTYLAMDVGLVQVDDVSQWTSNIYGLPATGELADVYAQNLTLQLIDQRLVAHGGVSGYLEGRVKALFYRYRSVGGYDYVGDLLVAPADGSRSPVHGDSGTVWNLDVTDAAKRATSNVDQLELLPFAVLWGGQTFEVSGERSNFTVATTLSNVCRMLDVELVTNRNRGVAGYWGRSGHYSIAAFAIELVQDPDLKQLLRDNKELLTFDTEALASTRPADLMKNLDFVPLADVADEVWKKFKSNPGGRDTQVSQATHQSDGPEHPNHYADIDAVYKNGKTMRQLCLEDPQTYLTPQAFIGYYNWLATTYPTEHADKSKVLKQGLLPFRVRQAFKRMKGYASSDLVSFVAAAGLTAHYLGDSCQPLHGSVYADGDPSRTYQFTHPQTGEVETLAYAKGVHSAYETNMVDRYRSDLFGDIATKLKNKNGHGMALYDTSDADLEVVRLMDDTAKILKPMDILDKYNELGGGPKASVAALDGLWQEFGDRTADVMVRGAMYLARFWDSAWAVGNGDATLAIPADMKAALKAKYLDVTFLPSLTLKTIGPEL